MENLSSSRSEIYNKIHLSHSTLSSGRGMKRTTEQIDPTAQKVQRIFNHLKNAVSTQLTIPKTPVLATRNRARGDDAARSLSDAARAENGQQPDNDGIFRFRASLTSLNLRPPGQHPGPSTGGQEPTMGPTRGQWDTRSVRKRRMEQNAARLRYQNARPFSARPMLSKSTRAPLRGHHTVPRPFNLETDRRGEVKDQRFQEMVEQEEREMRENALVHANPIPGSHDHPYVPVRPEPTVTAPDEVRLHTKERREERAEYDAELQERRAEREREAEAKEQRAREAEAWRVQQLRREAVHRPEPVRRYKPIVIRPSDRPVTAPHSPHFLLRPRRKCCSRGDLH